eukprot:scaffold15521_cov56-Phaeocystis_antarctica.AAC.2
MSSPESTAQVQRGRGAREQAESGESDTGHRRRVIFLVLIAKHVAEPSLRCWCGAAGSRDEPGPPQLRGAQREATGRRLVSLCLAEGPLELADGHLVAAGVDELALLHQPNVGQAAGQKLLLAALAALGPLPAEHRARRRLIHALIGAARAA